jgi:hypothetical protein
MKREGGPIGQHVYQTLGLTRHELDVSERVIR